MTHAMPWVFAVLAALSVGAIVIAFWQSVRAALGLIGTDEVAEERFAGSDRDLLSRRHAVLAAIRELDFDHEAGKLSDDDHKEARERLRDEAKRVMKAIDEVVAPHRAKAEALFDDHARRAESATVSESASESVSESVSESASASVSESGSESASVSESATVSASASASAPASTFAPRACRDCGTGNDSDAAFCKRCGKPLVSEARA